MNREIIAKFAVLSIIFTLALSVNYIFAVWTGPTAPPPGNNTPTPVNVGSTAQTKLGAFIAGGMRSLTDLYVDDNVGIGTLSPSTGGEQDLNLDVEGAVGAKYYCDENGNNCVTAPFGGGGGGGVSKIIAGNNITISPSTGVGNVTINSPGGNVRWCAVNNNCAGTVIACLSSGLLSCNVKSTRCFFHPSYRGWTYINEPGGRQSSNTIVCEGGVLVK
jgi:hypothetical protein